MRIVWLGCCVLFGWLVQFDSCLFVFMSRMFSRMDMTCVSYVCIVSGRWHNMCAYVLRMWVMVFRCSCLFVVCCIAVCVFVYLRVVARSCCVLASALLNGVVGCVGE